MTETQPDPDVDLRGNELGCLSGKISKELIFLDHGGDSELHISVHDQVFKNPVQCTQRNISEEKCWQISLCNQGRGIYTTFSPLISPDLAEGRVSIFVLWQMRAIINSSLCALRVFFQVTVCLFVHLLKPETFRPLHYLKTVSE